MAVAVISKLPAAVDQVMFEKVSEKIGAHQHPPDGLVAHMASQTDTGIEIFDLWESEADFRKFFQERVAPQVQAAAQQMGLPAPQGEPELRSAFDVIVRAEEWVTR